MFKNGYLPSTTGLLHDKLSLMWGDCKDKVDELMMEMNKHAYMFEEFKKHLERPDSDPCELQGSVLHDAL